MKKLLIVTIVVILLFSGCVQKTESQRNTWDNISVGDLIEVQKTVKNGDNISLDYVAMVNGRIVDTSIESIAKENNLSIPNKKYKQITFVVGNGRVIKGLEEGIIGMKMGESKTLSIPPEKAFGLKDPKLIRTIPIIQNVSRITSFPRIIDISVDQFDSIFGANHTTGDVVKIPDTNNSLTVENFSSSIVSLSYNLKVGDEMLSQKSWKETVVDIDEHNITTRTDAKKNETYQLGGNPWNTTVIDIDSDNIILRHNKVPDINMYTGVDKKTRIHFDDNFIIMDSNNEFAGETLVYNVTIRSIF